MNKLTYGLIALFLIVFWGGLIYFGKDFV